MGTSAGDACPLPGQRLEHHVNFVARCSLHALSKESKFHSTQAWLDCTGSTLTRPPLTSNKKQSRSFRRERWDTHQMCASCMLQSLMLLLCPAAEPPMLKNARLPSETPATARLLPNGAKLHTSCCTSLSSLDSRREGVRAEPAVPAMH